MLCRNLNLTLTLNSVYFFLTVVKKQRKTLEVSKGFSDRTILVRTFVAVQFRSHCNYLTAHCQPAVVLTLIKLHHKPTYPTEIN